MSKSTNDILETVIDEYNKEKLLEDCKKFGIDYHEPHFEPVMFIEGENEVAIPYFYLTTDLDKSENMRNALKEYNKVFWYYRENEDAINPFKAMAAAIKYARSVKKIEKIGKAESIKCFSRHDMNKYLEEYRKEKEHEVKKAKAIIEVAKEEMKLEK